MRVSFTACLVGFALASTLQAADPARFMMEAEVQGVKFEGTPVFWSTQQVLLLARDGYLCDFKPSDAKNFRKTGSSFQSFSVTQMRDRLERELGREFEVTGTGHYLVAHPRGHRDWAERFETLYRSFLTYFGTRGFQLKTPDFPLVAIVWKNQNDFLRYAAREKSQVSGNVLGYYSSLTNRITLYDLGAKGNAAASQHNLDTIIHEAAHQVAFNSGIHSRFAPPPRWVSEGLGTMFEAPGVWDPRTHTRQSDRINRGRLGDFEDYAAKKHKPGFVADLVSSDRMFDQDPITAYANAWALTFFLSETQPRDYARYLARTANRPAFETYSSIKRTADFTSVFGENFRLFEARFLRFIESLN